MAKTKQITIPKPTLLLISRLTPHPRNYRTHPEIQLEHMRESLRSNGFYRNVVIAKDSTILAGHGIVEAAESIGMQRVTCVRLPIKSDSAAAMKILAGDNYLSHFADDNDRMLTDLLREIAEDDSLVGTGFDDLSLAALVMVTRPVHEIETFDEAAEWVGMPAMMQDEHATSKQIRLMLTFDNVDSRSELLETLGIETEHLAFSVGGAVVSSFFPPRVRDDNASVRFQ